MTSKDGGRNVCFSICFVFVFVFIFAVAITIVAISYVHGKPRLYIQDLYIPSLHNSTNNNINSTIFIDFKFLRTMPLNTLRFEDFNVTLFYGTDRSLPVGNQTLRGFSQGIKGRSHKRVAVEAHALPWDDAFRRISGGMAVELVVELVAIAKYEHCDYDRPSQCTWSEGEAEAVAADVLVDGSGEKVGPKPIRLRKVK